MRLFPVLLNANSFKILKKKLVKAMLQLLMSMLKLLMMKHVKLLLIFGCNYMSSLLLRNLKQLFFAEEVQMIKMIHVSLVYLFVLLFLKGILQRIVQEDLSISWNHATVTTTCGLQISNCVTMVEFQSVPLFVSFLRFLSGTSC